MLEVILPAEVSYTNAAIFFRDKNGEFGSRAIDKDRQAVLPHDIQVIQVRALMSSGPTGEPSIPSAAVGGQSISSKLLPFGCKRDQITTLKFKLSRNIWSGLMYALGAHTEQYELQLGTVFYTSLPSKHLPI